MENECSKALNDAREAYVNALNRYSHELYTWKDDILSDAQDYIYELDIALSAQSAEIKQLRMQVGDRDREGAATTAHKSTLRMVEKLAQPLSALGSTAVEINGKPQTALNASSVDNREKLSSANVKQSGGGHTRSSTVVSVEYLKNTLHTIETEMINMIAHEGSVLKERLPDHRLINAWTECQADMVFKTIHAIERALPSAK